MSILVDRTTPVWSRGIPAGSAVFTAGRCSTTAPTWSAVWCPGKGGDKVHGVPVFDTVKEAAAKPAPVQACVFVPPPFAADAIMEAADAGLKLCIAITDGIPAHDMIRVKRYMRRYARTVACG